jgi:hypothetical protein
MMEAAGTSETDSVHGATTHRSTHRSKNLKSYLHKRMLMKIK